MIIRNTSFRSLVAMTLSELARATAVGRMAGLFPAPFSCQRQAMKAPVAAGLLLTSLAMLIAADAPAKPNWARISFTQGTQLHPSPTQMTLVNISTGKSVTKTLAASGGSAACADTT